MMVADIILIYVTWTNLSGLDTWREMRHARRLSLPDIFVREGTRSSLTSGIFLTHYVSHLTAYHGRNCLLHVRPISRAQSRY